VSRAQKIALVAAAVLLLVLGLVAAIKAGQNGGGSAESGGAASAPQSGGTSTPSTVPVSVKFIEFSNGPSNDGGWGTDVTLVFVGTPAAKMTVSQPRDTVAGGTDYQVTFDRPVSISDDVITAAGNGGDQVLLQLAWGQSAQSLVVTVEAYAGDITKTVTGVDGNRSTLEFVRTPLPRTQNDCIQMDQPVPFTKLYGITAVSGKAQLFEGGPMTVVARVPGQGQKQTRIRTSTGDSMVPFSGQIELPPPDQPAQGYVAAYDHSAKDGSHICNVKVPVYMDPGG
jgi:immunoglobulin-like protein involved in spore germination